MGLMQERGEEEIFGGLVAGGFWIGFWRVEMDAEGGRYSYRRFGSVWVLRLDEA